MEFGRKKIIDITDEDIFVDIYKEKAEELEKNHARRLDIIECLKRIHNNS